MRDVSDAVLPARRETGGLVIELALLEIKFEPSLMV
jgi:hypothetical protein